MKRWSMVILVGLLALVWIKAIPAQAQSMGPGSPANPLLGTGKPVVHVLLFGRETCPHCHEIRDRFLPPLQARYGDALDIRYIEVKEASDLQAFYAMTDAYGIPRSQAGVPLLVVGQDALLGSDEIEQRFPALIEAYLAQGGVPFPSAAEKAGLHVSGGLENCNVNTPQACENEPAASTLNMQNFMLRGGGWLAVMVLLALGVTLVLSVGQVLRKGWPTQIPGRLFPVLILFGLIVAGYLTYVETQAVLAVCGPVGDCNAVQSSAYAKLFGVVPVALLGFIGYLAMGAAWFLAQRVRPTWRRSLIGMIWGMAAFGVAFSIYLTGLEIFVLRAVCLWCIASAGLMLGCLGVCNGWVVWPSRDNKTAR